MSWGIPIFKNPSKSHVFIFQRYVIVECTASDTCKTVNCITKMLRALVMQKKQGTKPASGASEKAFEVTPSRMSEDVFLECRTNISFIQSYTKSYILYSFI